MKNKAVFLDRDGVLIRDVHHLQSPHELRLLPRSAEAVRRIHARGFKIIVITNQAGVAYGYFSEDMVRHVNRELENRLRRYGAELDKVYVCPHHPEGRIKKYRRLCKCRKPGIQNLLKARARFNLDLRKSYFIGDKLSDMDAGRHGGCTTILVKSGHGRQNLRLLRSNLQLPPPDYVCSNLWDALRWIH